MPVLVGGCAARPDWLQMESAARGASLWGMVHVRGLARPSTSVIPQRRVRSGATRMTKREDLDVHSHSDDNQAAVQEAIEPAEAVGDQLDESRKAHDEIFAKGSTFADLGLRNSVLKGVTAAGFEYPTSIQHQLIPLILSGRDVIGQAKTGTGKTAAFGLPLIHMQHRNVGSQTLILAPTRELAIQIAAELQELAKFTPVRVAPIYGGQRISSQVDKLRREPEIIVGTPGRLMDLVERRMLSFKNVRFAVLDEVDRMLDIGFREDIRRILNMCPKDRQTIFVSATISPDIEKLGRQYMKDPEKLVVASSSLTVSLVQQLYLTVQPWDKKRLLRHLLTHEEPALTLVFCRLKRACDELARYLSDKGIDAHAIHADLPQSKRNRVMEKLRSGQLSVLIASDLASRGIDVENITHVINYDLPEDVELYVHRIGRTARAGRGGIAWSFVTPDQGYLLTQIEQLINTEIPKLDYPDFEPGQPPAHLVREREDRQRIAAAKASRFTSMPESAPPPASAEPATAGGSAPAAPAADPSKFPGGVVPTKLPTKRMFGKIRSGRR
jgi:ATP-dependent RNA helicase DeaD